MQLTSSYQHRQHLLNDVTFSSMIPFWIWIIHKKTSLAKLVTPSSHPRVQAVQVLVEKIWVSRFFSRFFRNGKSVGACLSRTCQLGNYTWKSPFSLAHEKYVLYESIRTIYLIFVYTIQNIGMYLHKKRYIYQLHIALQYITNSTYRLLPQPLNPLHFRSCSFSSLAMRWAPAAEKRCQCRLANESHRVMMQPRCHEYHV